MSIEGLHYKKPKIVELHKQIMRVLERNNATTEEGFCAMVTALRAVVDNEALHPLDRKTLRKKIIDAMEAERIVGPQLVLPDGAN